MDEKVRSFLEAQHGGAMITLRADGTPHAARVGVAVVDDRLWSSGTQDRLRTRNLRRDPRSTLFVFDSASPKWLGLETTVSILEGPDVPVLSVRLFGVMQGRSGSPGTLAWFGGELSEDEFKERMRQEGRLIYEFNIQRAYGFY